MRRPLPSKMVRARPPKAMNYAVGFRGGIRL